MDGVPPLGDFATTPIYNTKAVVRETEVPADTFRAWERRYGVPRPQRTAGGHRLYSERDIATIRWLRDRTAEGMNISQAVRLLLAAENGVADPPPAPSLPTLDPRSLQRLHDDLLEAMMSFDAGHGERLLSEAFALHPFDDVLLRLIQPLMIEIGERWHRGEISVAVEHFTTQFMRRKLSSLLSDAEPRAARGRIVVACAPDELHDLGALFVALFLMRRGWHIVYLGPQVPKADLLEAVQALQPDLVCLAASMPETALQLVDASKTIQQYAPHIRVGYGGRVFNLQPELRQAMRGTFLGQDAREVVSNVAALFPSRPTSAAAS